MEMKLKLAIKKIFLSSLLSTFIGQHAIAAISLDRTRIIYNGGERSVSLSISNENKSLPYLAQSWLQNPQGEKINSPLLVLPPLQRIEPGQKSAIKVQALPAAKMLPQDRESLFYFNLREIPPRSEKSNVLQIALQTRIKLFYRPEGIKIGTSNDAINMMKQITLTKKGDKYVINNPTPYFITIVGAAENKEAQKSSDFKPVMIEPKSMTNFPASITTLGLNPVLTYINDFGGRPNLYFSCSAGKCQVVAEKE